MTQPPLLFAFQLEEQALHPPVERVDLDVRVRREAARCRRCGRVLPRSLRVRAGIVCGRRLPTLIQG